MDNLVVENVITIEALPAVTASSNTKVPSPPVGRLSVIFNIAARRPMASLHRLWTNRYQRGALWEEGVTMPGSALNFVIAGLLSFAAIKSQGETRFPYPQTIMVAITSLLMYGLASAAEHAISDARPDPPSVYAIIARLGRKCCLYILVGSLASLFYL